MKVCFNGINLLKEQTLEPKDNNCRNRLIREFDDFIQRVMKGETINMSCLKISSLVSKQKLNSKNQMTGTATCIVEFKQRIKRKLKQRY